MSNDSGPAGDEGNEMDGPAAPKAPTLLRRLRQRSGVMTYDSSSDALIGEVQPSSRLMCAAQLVQQHAHNGAVLDVGCWTAGLARALPRAARRSYTGVDIEPAAQAVETARRAVPEARFVLVPSVEALPFPAASFDAVVLTEVIEHVRAGREGPLLAEVARVLRPGGSIILSTPYHNLLNPLDPAWFFGHRHYSVRRMAQLARRHGLSMADVMFTGGVWAALDTNLLYVYKHVLHRPYRGYRWLHALVEREYRFSPRGLLATTLWCRLVR